MPDVLTNLLYGVGVILIMTRFLGGQDLGIIKIPDLSLKKSNIALGSGVALILSMLAYENKNIFVALWTGEDVSEAIRFTPNEKSKIVLSDGETFEGAMESRVYSDHNYIYLRLDEGVRLQLYKGISKPIGANDQGCQIELVAYSEVPPTADVEITCR